MPSTSRPVACTRFSRVMGWTGFHYAAINHAPGDRALKVYARHNQQNAVDFIDYMTCKLSFRIHAVCTNNGHEFQAQFHWLPDDFTDDVEFYQLLTYAENVNLNGELNSWEEFYNLRRPRGALPGYTYYEVLRESLRG